MQIKRSGKSLKQILFHGYARTILILFLLLFIATAVFIANDRVNRLTELQTNLCSSGINALEGSIDTMSMVSMNVLYSSSIRDKLKSVNPETANTRRMDPIYEAVSSIIGPNGTVTQVNLYSNRNLQVGWGVYELCGKEEYPALEYYEAIKAKNGHKYFGEPQYRSELAYYNYYLKTKKFISLYRMFYGSYYEENGIVEIIQDCDIFFSYLNSLKTENSQLDIYVFDENNHLIYPYQEDTTVDSARTDQLVQAIAADSDGLITKLSRGKFVSHATLNSMNWKIVVEQDKSYVLQPVIWFLAVYLCIGLVFLVIIGLICYRVAWKVSDPIFNLMARMESIDLTNIINNTPVEKADYPIHEISMLSNVFEDMYTRLEGSTKDLMSSRIEEIRAKMIATQSMIKPHFIFNNLANISIMAEEQMNEEIVTLCKNLCDYLRYISADSLTTVDVSTEIFYTEKYLECMKIRYGKRLDYIFDIPKELENVKISKLTLQPIIENALKYAFQNDPPWILKISGQADSQGWELSVSDNGIGIQPAYQTEIMENLKRIRETKDISNMHIGGMGLANVYLRLTLLHGDDARLVFENLENGGTKVTIRAPFRNSGDEKNSSLRRQL